MRDQAKAAELCLSCLLTMAALAAAVLGSFAYLSLGLDRLFSLAAAREMLDYFASFVPPDLSTEFLTRTARASLETIAISATGTLLALMLGLILALPASGRYGTGLRALSRWLLIVLRAVPELVWAVLMVLAVGLGPFAGTLALALHTAGVLGRLFAEALENVATVSADALLESGAPASLAFLYGTVPRLLPQIVAYTLYRWEMNVRMAAILGFVGAGGLGQMLYYELSLFHQAQSCTVIVAILLLSAAVDALSQWTRRGWKRIHV